MKWSNAWHWIAGPILAGILLGFVGGISKDPSGRLVQTSNFDWKTGLKGFAVFAILYLLVFLGWRGGRYLIRRGRRPN
jgi:hypothetical protein